MSTRSRSTPRLARSGPPHARVSSSSSSSGCAPTASRRRSGTPAARTSTAPAGSWRRPPPEPPAVGRVRAGTLTPHHQEGADVHGESTPAVEAGREFVLTVSCPDRRGIVHAVTGVMLEQNLTIADAQQFGDPSSGEFHLRMHLVREGTPLAVEDLRAAMEPTAEEFA